MQTLIASIFVFGLLIIVHELGHYFVARLTGIKVLELAIGFGPKIVSWRKNEIDYSLRAVPLGGFCRMLGENPDEDSDPDSFSRKPPLSRAAVLVAGAAMNLVLAVVVFFIIFFFLVGVPTESSQIGYIIENSPAESAGLESGDTIKSIDGTPVSNWEDVLINISAKPAQEIELRIERNGSEKQVKVVSEIAPEDDSRGIIGIGPQIEKYRFLPSLQISLERFALIITSIYQVLTGQAPLDVTGPVGIVYVISEVAQTGFINLLMLTGLISISLGIMNLLPIPALDGGRLFFLLVEVLRGKRIDPEKEGFIHFIGFALLIILILFITYQDLLRFDILPGK